MSKITDYIYLGSYYNARSDTFIKDYNIKYILNVAEELDSKPLYFRKTQYLKVSMDDKVTQCLKIEPCLKFICNAVKKQKNILIHCHLGVSRSASIVIAYLILRRCMDFKNAFALVRKKRQKININSGFISQLKMLDN